MKKYVDRDKLQEFATKLITKLDTIYTRSQAIGSNPNLLDNPWFTVNQRGASAFTAVGYTADRWYKYQTYGIVTPSTSGLGINLNGDSYVELRSMYELDRFATSGNGKTFTISMMLSDGRIQSKQFTMASSGLDTNVYFSFNSTNDVRVNFYTTATLFTVRILLYLSCTIRAVKLELGTVSTLANDTPPDYGTELAKCQRYFVRLQGLYAFIGSGWCANATTAWIYVPLPVPMRAIPTVSFTGLYLVASSTFAVSALSVLGNNAMTASTLSLRATSTGLTTDTPCIAQFRDSGTYIDLSADL